jgi:flagellar hook-associated protein 2
MNITTAGIGSGLDLEGIIEAYVNAEAVPNELRLQEKEERLKTEISGVGSFKSALSSFEATLKTLSNPDDFNKQVITASNSDISVVTNGFASNGSFSIEVDQLAQGTRLQSTNFTAASDTVGSGSLTFQTGADTFNVAIGAGDTLSVIRDKINESSDNTGVVANVITTDAGTFLTYSSEVTGVANSLTVTASDISLDAISTNVTTKQTAQDAIIKIDGNTVTNSTNEFKNNIEDVTITASVVNTGSPTTLTIAQDEENGKKLLTDFVNGYNTLVNTMSGLSNPESGELAFDSSIRQMKSQLNSIIGATVPGLSGSIDSLNGVGISLTREGTLEFSSVGFGTLPSGVATRDDVLANKLNEVGELFASDGGVTSKISDLLASYNDSEGSLTKRQSLLNSDLSGIKDEYDALETRLRNYEDTLRRKFTFLDSTVAKYTATSDWLTSALAPPEKK